jgi:hypothetical protein
MVAEPRTWVDVEAAVRAWAREVLPSLGGRVFFGYSRDAAKSQVVLMRIGGTDDACLIQFDCWGESKSQAAAIASDLATAIDALGRYTSGGVLLHGAVVENVRWQTDRESDEQRYTVDATFTATATS